MQQMVTSSCANRSKCGVCTALSAAAGLMPTVLLGTAVGAAVVYGIDEGDPMAVQKKVLPKVRRVLVPGDEIAKQQQ
jgi:hypothetical protein